MVGWIDLSRSDDPARFYLGEWTMIWTVSGTLQKYQVSDDALPAIEVERYPLSVVMA